MGLSRNDKNKLKKPRKCNFSQCLRKGTFFAKSNLQLWQILGFVLLWTRNVPSSALMIEVEIYNNTAVDWGSFCREVAFHAISEQKEKIGGEGHVVQIDESKFGKRKYNRGKRVEGQWVFGGIDVGTGHCFMEAVENRSSRTLIPILEKYVLPGTTVVSDLWKACDCLEERGFHHHTVNHSLSFKDPVTGAHTNNIEASWNAVKTALPRYHRKKAFFPGYLAKYLFLKRCKSQGKDPFIEFFKAAGSLYKPENTIIMEQDVEIDEEIEEDDFN
ncbi:uncharacterized protein LOC120350666 [Nilaparvata lugens]|uniref:uncharacterized protein LOC120350666 n=1 Tax=Nilaparvata lugens TaxID=108931 RepID=UPI00193CF136|nr:uncharacterized protein LOC120350666 [Nilaparvata lugens]